MKQQREGESLQGGICGRVCELRVGWALGAVWCLGKCQDAVLSQSLALVAESSLSPGSCDVLWQGTACCSEGHRARQDLSCCRGQSVAGLGQRCWSREGIAVTASPCSEQQQVWSCPFSPLFLMCFEGLDPQPHGGNCSCLGRARSLDDPLHFTGPFV